MSLISQDPIIAQMYQRPFHTVVITEHTENVLANRYKGSYEAIDPLGY